MTTTAEASYGDQRYLNYKKDMEGIQAGSQVAQALPEVGIALFGLGRIGTIHLENVRENPRARLLYCVEESKDRSNFVRNKWKLVHTTFIKPADQEKVFKDKSVDAIIICTPTFAHEDLILKGLEAGKAVFCEKPLALTEEGIEKCLRAKKKYNKPLLCAFNRRFDPSLRSLKARVDSGEIGKVQIIKTCSRDSPKPGTDYLKISGGIFHDCAVHDIDYICWVAGEYPESISVYAHTYFEDIKELGDYDTVGIMMKFPSGTIGIIDLSRYAVHGYDQRVEVFGNKGMLNIEGRRPIAVKYHNEKGTTQVPIFYSFVSMYQEAYTAEMEHFLNVVQGLEECEVKPESVLSISKIATACGKIVNSGKSCSLDLNK